MVLPGPDNCGSPFPSARLTGTYSQMQCKVFQADRTVLAGWHLRKRIGAPDALTLVRTQQDALPDHEMRDANEAECCIGRRVVGMGWWGMEQVQRR